MGTGGPRNILENIQVKKDKIDLSKYGDVFHNGKPLLELPLSEIKALRELFNQGLYDLDDDERSQEEIAKFQIGKNPPSEDEAEEFIAGMLLDFLREKESIEEANEAKIGAAKQSAEELEAEAKKAAFAELNELTKETSFLEQVRIKREFEERWSSRNVDEPFSVEGMLQEIAEEKRHAELAAAEEERVKAEAREERARQGDAEKAAQEEAAQQIKADDTAGVTTGGPPPPPPMRTDVGNPPPPRAEDLPPPPPMRTDVGNPPPPRAEDLPPPPPMPTGAGKPPPPRAEDLPPPMPTPDGKTSPPKVDDKAEPSVTGNPILDGLDFGARRKAIAGSNSNSSEWSDSQSKEEELIDAETKELEAQAKKAAFAELNELTKETSPFEQIRIKGEFEKRWTSRSVDEPFSVERMLQEIAEENRQAQLATDELADAPIVGTPVDAEDIGGAEQQAEQTADATIQAKEDDITGALDAEALPPVGELPKDSPPPLTAEQLSELPPPPTFDATGAVVLPPPPTAEQLAEMQRLQQEASMTGETVLPPPPPIARDEIALDEAVVERIRVLEASVSQKESLLAVLPVDQRGPIEHRLNEDRATILALQKGEPEPQPTEYRPKPTELLSGPEIESKVAGFMAVLEKTKDMITASMGDAGFADFVAGLEDTEQEFLRGFAANFSSAIAGSVIDAEGKTVYLRTAFMDAMDAYNQGDKTKMEGLLKYPQVEALLQLYSTFANKLEATAEKHNDFIQRQREEVKAEERADVAAPEVILPPPIELTAEERAALDEQARGALPPPPLPTTGDEAQAELTEEQRVALDEQARGAPLPPPLVPPRTYNLPSPQDIHDQLLAEDSPEKQQTSELRAKLDRKVKENPDLEALAALDSDARLQAIKKDYPKYADVLKDTIDVTKAGEEDIATLVAAIFNNLFAPLTALTEHLRLKREAEAKAEEAAQALPLSSRAEDLPPPLDMDGQPLPPPPSIVRSARESEWDQKRKDIIEEVTQSQIAAYDHELIQAELDELSAPSARKAELEDSIEKLKGTNATAYFDEEHKAQLTEKLDQAANDFGDIFPGGKRQLESHEMPPPPLPRDEGLPPPPLPRDEGLPPPPPPIADGLPPPPPPRERSARDLEWDQKRKNTIDAVVQKQRTALQQAEFDSSDEEEKARLRGHIEKLEGANPQAHLDTAHKAELTEKLDQAANAFSEIFPEGMRPKEGYELPPPPRAEDLPPPQGEVPQGTGVAGLAEGFRKNMQAIFTVTHGERAELRAGDTAEQPPGERAEAAIHGEDSHDIDTPMAGAVNADSSSLSDGAVHETEALFTVSKGPAAFTPGRELSQTEPQGREVGRPREGFALSADAMAVYQREYGNGEDFYAKLAGVIDFTAEQNTGSKLSKDHYERCHQIATQMDFAKRGAKAELDHLRKQETPPATEEQLKAAQGKFETAEKLQEMFVSLAALSKHRSRYSQATFEKHQNAIVGLMEKAGCSDDNIQKIVMSVRGVEQGELAKEKSSKWFKSTKNESTEFDSTGDKYQIDSKHSDRFRVEHEDGGKKVRVHYDFNRANLVGGNRTRFHPVGRENAYKRLKDQTKDAVLIAIAEHDKGSFDNPAKVEYGTDKKGRTIEQPDLGLAILLEFKKQAILQDKTFFAINPKTGNKFEITPNSKFSPEEMSVFRHYAQARADKNSKEPGNTYGGSVILQHAEKGAAISSKKDIKNDALVDKAIESYVSKQVGKEQRFAMERMGAAEEQLGKKNANKRAGF